MLGHDLDAGLKTDLEEWEHRPKQRNDMTAGGLNTRPQCIGYQGRHLAISHLVLCSLITIVMLHCTVLKGARNPADVNAVDRRLSVGPPSQDQP